MPVRLVHNLLWLLGTRPSMLGQIVDPGIVIAGDQTRQAFQPQADPDNGKRSGMGKSTQKTQEDCARYL